MDESHPGDSKMPYIHNPGVFGKVIAQGVEAFALARRKSIGEAQEEIASLLEVQSDAIVAWKAGSKPRTIDDRRLFRFVWVILCKTDKTMVWLQELLGATTIPLPERPTPDYIQSIFQHTRLFERLGNEKQRADQTETAFREIWAEYELT